MVFCTVYIDVVEKGVSFLADTYRQGDEWQAATELLAESWNLHEGPWRPRATRPHRSVVDTSPTVWIMLRHLHNYYRQTHHQPAPPAAAAVANDVQLPDTVRKP